MKKISTRVAIPLILWCILISGWCISPAIAGEQAILSSIVVKLKPGLSVSEQEALVGRDGGIRIASIPALRMYVIAIPEGEDLNRILLNYQSDPLVERAEPNKERQAEAQPNDTLYGVQWAMPKIGWESVYGSIIPLGNAIVALLDTGVYANHPDFGDNLVLPGISMLDSNSDGRSDSNGHGTKLAGIIGAVANNGEGIAGVCTSGVKILPVTVLNADGIGSDGDIIAGLVWAVDQGADVILMGFSNTDFSQNLQDAIDYAWGKGAVIVAAAGNAGVAIPAFPAGNRGVIGVSATDQDDLLATGSNYGQAVFLAAPGENLFTTNAGGQDLYTYISGTSASSAVVAGVAAFMKATDSTLTNGVIVGRLAKTADAVGSNSDPAINEAMFGNGRINMANALDSKSTTFIQPVGAMPMGSGGPYVGPYVAAEDELELHVTFNASTSTISAHGEELHSSWVYQYAYQNPAGAIVYHACNSGISARWDQFPLPAGYQAGTWTVYLHAYNPYYTTCQDNGSAVKTATRMRTVAVTTGQNSTPTVTAWPTASAITYGQALSASTLSGGSASVDGAFSFDAPAVVPNAGSYSAAVIFTPVDPAYNPVSGAVSVTVNKVTPTVTTWPVAGTIVYGEALSASTLSGGSASVAGTFSFAAPATVPDAGSYSAAVVFSPTDPNYDIVTGSVTVTVNKVTPTVTAWPAAGTILYGQALSASTLSGGSASVAGTFSFAAPATVPNAGSYSAAVVFSPTDPNYDIVTGSVTVTVNKVTPTVTVWPVAGTIVYGQPLSASTLSGGSASVAGTFSFAAPATVPNAGSYSAAVVFAPADGENYTNVFGTSIVTVSPAYQSISFGPLSGVVYGAAPFHVSATATSGLPVSFNSLTASICNLSGDTVTVTGVGICSIEALQTGGPNYYAAAPVVQSFTVSSGTLDHFSFTTANTPLVAGSPFEITLTAQDAWNNTVTSFAGMVDLSTTAGTITPLATQPFAEGVWTGTVMVSGAGTGKTITATAGAITGTSNPFDVMPGAAVAFTVTAPAITGAGTPFDVAVTAKDAYNNTASGYTGTVHFTTSDPKTGISIPADYSFLAEDNGSRIFSGIVLETAGVQTITAADLASISISGTSGSIAVNPAVAAKLSITAPATTTAGTPFDITVTVKDSFDNDISGYIGTVRFTSSDPQGVVPANYTFVAEDNGRHTFSGVASLKTSGVHTLAAADLFSPAIAGTSGSIAVNSSAATMLVFSQQPVNGVPGLPIVPAVALSLLDQYGNVAAGSTADVTIELASTSHAGVLTGTTTRSAANGIATFADLALVAEGNGYMLTATATGLPPINSAIFDIIIGSCGKPAELSVPVSNDTGTIALSWSASNVVGATYVLEQSRDGGAFSEAYRGTNTSVNIGVAVSGTYTYRVKALKDGYLSSDYTVGSNGCTVRLTCLAPASLTVPATSTTGAIAISWGVSNVGGATYVLEQSRDGGAFVEVYSGTNTLTTITVPANGTYHYRVKATKYGYFSSDYTVSTVGCVAQLACGKPAVLTVPVANNTGMISLFWSASDVSGATYVLEQSRDGGAFVEVYSGTNTLTSIAVTANGSYSYRVKAQKVNYDTSGYTMGSSACAVHLACGKPAVLTVPSTNSTGTFYISWSASDVSDATYVLEQSRDGGAFVEVYSGTNTLTSISVTANGSYSYRVKAQKPNYDTSGYTLGSSACAVHLACGKPASLNVPAINSTGIFYISWGVSDVDGVTYVLEQSRDGGTFVEVYSGTSTLTTVTITANGSYSYRVKAQKANYDTSGYTFGSSVCAVHLACGNPASLTVPAANSTGSFYISWKESDVSGATYVLEQSKDGGAFVEVYNGTNTLTGITVTANGSYSYRVKAQKANYDTSGYTVGSSACAVHLACGKPPALTVPATNSTGVIDISWSASDVSGATYVLEQSREGGAFVEVYRGANISASISVAANGSYSYRVKAQKVNYDTSDYVAGSNACAVHLACGKPASLIVPVSNSTGTIAISWSASDVSGATYVLEQSKDGGAFSEVYSGTNTLTSITVTANGSYSYRVKAQKSNYDASDYTVGNSLCSVHLACGKPVSLTVPTGNSTGMAYISWSAADVGGATYVLEQSRDGGAFVEVYNGTNMYSYVSLAANGSYSYRVKAQKANYDASDYTVGSNPCAVHLSCGKPSSLTVPASNSTGSFYISWKESDVSGATYVLEQSRDGGAFVEVYSGTNTLASITVTVSGSYSYRVKAQKVNYDSSDYTLGSSVCAVHLACGKPASLTVPASNSTGSFYLSWGASDVSGATYVLEQSRDGGAFTEVYRGTNTLASITVTVDGSYSYRVKAQKSGYDESLWTDGSFPSVVTIFSKIKITVAGQPDSYFATISAAVGGISSGASVVLKTWETSFTENINLDKIDTTVTIGGAFDSSYSTRIGPVDVRGIVTVSRGILVVESLVIR